MDKVIERPKAILFDLGSTLLKDSLSGNLKDRVQAQLMGEVFRPYVEKGFDLPSALENAVESLYLSGLKEFHVKSWLKENLLTGNSDPAGSPEVLEGVIRSRIISY